MGLRFESTQKDYFGDAISVNKSERQAISKLLHTTLFVTSKIKYFHLVFPRNSRLQVE